MVTIKNGKMPLESAEEAEFVKLCKALPVKLRKLNGLGNRSWPDRMVLGPNGFVMFVEMKRKKIGKLSAGQEELFKDMGALGHHVFIFDDGHEAAAWVKAGLIAHGVTIF